ncbi:MAG: amidohydrolase family protein [Myxococcota bacterium]|nr:amidohydrolase family protein [Myxococcota bacterium]
MTTYSGPIFDADNHFYEAHDAFIRHVRVLLREPAGRVLCRADPLLPRADAARVHGPRRAHRAHGRAGPRRRLALPHPFWARVNEAGITVVTHIGATRHDSNGYDTGSIDPLGLGPRPSVTNFHRSRNINDFLASMVFDRLFERFPNLRIASVENGAEFLGDLLRAFRRTRDRLPAYFEHDPVDTFREHVWINPFWEDDIPEVIEHMGADRVILGSDWPHMEGLEQPRDILGKLDGVAGGDLEKVLYADTKGLNERRPG